MEENLS